MKTFAAFATTVAAHRVRATTQARAVRHAFILDALTAGTMKTFAAFATTGAAHRIRATTQARAVGHAFILDALTAATMKTFAAFRHAAVPGAPGAAHAFVRFIVAVVVCPIAQRFHFFIPGYAGIVANWIATNATDRDLTRILTADARLDAVCINQRCPVPAKHGII